MGDIGRCEEIRLDVGLASSGISLCEIEVHVEIWGDVSRTSSCRVPRDMGRYGEIQPDVVGRLSHA